MNDPNDKLAGAFGFTEDDLAANRQGYLTPAKKKVIAETRRARGCGARAAYIAMGASVAIIVAAFVLAGGLRVPRSTGALTAFAVATSVFIGIFLAAIIYDRVRSHDLRTGKISVAEGPTQRRTKEYKFGTAFYVKIGRRRFQLAYREQFDAFNEGIYYRIYYVKNPPVHIITSIDTLENGVDPRADGETRYGEKG